MRHRIEMYRELEVENTLGECVLWDDVHQAFLWTDVEEYSLYRYSVDDDRLEFWSTPYRVASFGLIDNDTRLIVAFDRGIALFDLHTGAMDWLTPKTFLPAGLRLNDGRVDPNGRFCVGSMVEDPTLTCESGKLYLVDHNFRISILLSDLQIPNGLGWSPDGLSMYHTDSPTGTITVRNYPDLLEGKGSASAFASTKPGIHPDGATVDAKGRLWSANWQDSSVTCYTDSSEVFTAIEVPTSQPTCVSFGGRDLNLLMVSTARQGLSSEQLESEPAAGNVFIFKTAYKGIPEPRFKISK